VKVPALLVGFGLWVLGATACAHPVAQGSMRVGIAPDRIVVDARISVEEVFVESSLSKSQRAATTLDQLWPAHGEYLLHHLFVSADGALLAGRITEVTPPAVPTADQFVIYEIQYDLSAYARPPMRLALRENLLNEFTFAPGNVWEATFVTRIEQEGRPAQEALLLAARQPIAFACDWTGGATDSPRGGIDRKRLAGDYLKYGVVHILTGWDHLLFMAGLVLAAVTFGDLVKVVSAFTLAHTITLTLSVLDIFRLSPRIVDPMVAASIVFVAVQNIFWPARTRGWSRLAVAFGFGLFHGLGFAGGLLEAMQGLPMVAVVIAIAAFSLGVEIGHQGVVLPVFFGLRLARSMCASAAARERVTHFAMRYGSAFISLAGVFYLIVALRE
jgi:hypothetical protein